MYFFIKRFFDISASLIGLLLLGPFFVIIALLVKLDSPGSVFFKHERMGKNFRAFKMWKFRTMVPNAAQLGPALTLDKDQRITKTGHYLRKYKLDELPQLFNVLLGDMSFVGPRPEVPKYVALLQKEYTEILKVRPGITDLASLKFQNESAFFENKEQCEEVYLNKILPLKLDLNKKYINRASFWLDIKIIIVTIFSVFQIGFKGSFNKELGHDHATSNH